MKLDCKDIKVSDFISTKKKEKKSFQLIFLFFPFSFLFTSIINERAQFAAF